MLVLALASVSSLSVLAVAYTYEWTGSAPDSGVYNWLTAENWTSSNGGTTIPGNEDTAVFSQQDDYAITINVSANGTQCVQAIYVSEGAGALTIRTGQGWWTERMLQFRKDTGNPSITNFLNKSSKPVTFFGAEDSDLRVTVGNAWGECKFGPGAVYDLPFSVTDTKVWFVGQAEARTDNEEMNKTVFKKTADIKTADIGLNHWVEVSGTLAVTEDVAVKGKLILNGGAMSCATITQGEGGEVEVKGEATLTAGSINGNVFTFTPAFSMTGYDVTSDTTLKIAKSGLSAAPTTANFVVGAYSGITLKDGVSADDAFTFDIDDTTDAGYYIVTPKVASITYLGKIPLTAAYVADDEGNMTNATRVVLAKSLFDDAPTAADFEISGISGVTPAVKPLLAVSIGEEGDDYVVTVTPSKFITMKGSNAYNSDWTATDLWNGGYSIEAGGHYLVQGTGHRLNTEIENNESTFAGASLTFTGTSSGTCWLGIKSADCYFDNIFLGAHGLISFNNGRFRDGKQHIHGKIHIGEDTEGAAAYIKASESNTYVVDSDISGSGELRISTDGGGHHPSIEINGDNSQYFGKLIFEYNGSEYVTNIVATANALGGNPIEEMDDGVRIDNSTLRVTDNVVLTTTNRNFKFHHAARIFVDENKTFLIPSKLKFDSSFTDLTKLGAGALALAGDNSAASGTITVSEGALIAANAKSAGRMTVSVAEGARASLPSVEPTDVETADRKFTAKDWLFVPDGSALNTPDENIALMTGRGWIVPANYGLGKWRTKLGLYAVDGGVMLTVSGKLPGFAVVIR